MIHISMRSVADRFLKTLERLPCGSLMLTAPDGTQHHFKGLKEGPTANFILHDWSVMRRAMLRGDIALGEDYIAGLWDTDSIESLFSLFLVNMDALDDYAHGDWWRRIGFNIYNRILRRNNRKGSRQNIEAHYDVGNEFYKLWLDETMTYSSALFLKSSDDLATAQRQKYQRILDVVGPEASSILEIGCGWGGFAEAAAHQSQRVTGLTVSPAQHAFATARLGDRSEIRLQDYRDVKESFDAIVSIEMFEAVGERYWPAYFKAVKSCLRPGGKAVIQTITIRDAFFASYRTRSDFIRHYVFPGGMLPSLKRFKEEAAKAGLKTVHSFAFGQDYAETLRRWQQTLTDQQDAIRAMGYNDAFIRNWQFYLGICAAAFAVARTDVMQIELVHA